MQSRNIDLSYLKVRDNMTEIEAKKEFKERLELIEKCYRGEVEDYKQALELGVKALEKQIPKKPHKNFEKFSGVWCSCGKYFGKGYFVDKPIYCPNCGQKLDWGDEE